MAKRVVVLWEEGLPFIDTAPLTRQELADALDGLDVTFASVADFRRATAQRPDLVVTAHGSAFPVDAWPAFLDHLKSGGCWLHLGGAPLTRPCARSMPRQNQPATHEQAAAAASQWHVQHHQVQYGKDVMIRHTSPVALDGARTQYRASAVPRGDLHTWSQQLQDCQPQRAWSLQMLLTTNTGVFHGGLPSGEIPGECGCSGTRDALFTPLLQACTSEPYNKVLVAPLVAVDHVQGPFLGGRWVLAPCQTAKPFSGALIRTLADYALRPMVQLEVRPGYACYNPGESASLTLRASCPTPVELDVDVTVSAMDSGQVIWQRQLTMSTNVAEDYATIGPIPETRPGLYVVRATASPTATQRQAAAQAAPEQDLLLASAENGFWIYDDALMASAAPISIDGDRFVRRGQTFAVTGTTYMSTVSHRQWLVEPTPIAWERDFRAMREVGINMVRTGLWMGYRRYMAEPGVMDEAAVRSLQAFLLCARQYDTPVIFTCFAFVPETWRGGHAYLSPAAVKAQAAFVSSLSRRVANCNHLLWDFINEPSFANPSALWSPRPGGGSDEQAAWRQWLLQQADETEWRSRWRMTSAQPLALPEPGDFAEPHNPEATRPLRSMDFIRFGQEMFARWAATMRQVIRDNGNATQLVTVGQDESGLSKGPAPQLHGSSVDFTCDHPWWLNEHLLLGVLGTKRPDRPNLMEEVGVMFAERPDALPQRTMAESAALLERKLVLSFAGGTMGFVQWLWNTCPYNLSDNEAGIGLLRVDGSAKPELDVLRGVSKFMACCGPRLAARRQERVAVIIPHSSIFSVRDTGMDALRRCVRVLEYRLGVGCYLVSELAMDQLGEPDVIVLPSPRVLGEECWQAVLARVEAGATLLVSGFIEEDPWLRPVSRLAQFGLQTRSAPVLHEEILEMQAGDASISLSVTLPSHVAIMPRLEKAIAVDGSPLGIRQFVCGAGMVYYCPIPIENSLSDESIEVLYRGVIEPRVSGSKPLSHRSASGSGVLLRAVEYEDCTLWLIVNESSVACRHFGVDVPAGRAGIALVSTSGELLMKYEPVEL